MLHCGGLGLTVYFMFVFQFEGGLYTTAIVIDGAYRLAATAKTAPTLTEVHIIMVFLSEENKYQSISLHKKIHQYQ